MPGDACRRSLPSRSSSRSRSPSASAPPLASSSGSNRFLSEPLPYPSANRLAMIVEGRADGGRNGGTFAVYQEFLGRARTLDGIAVARAWQPTLVGQAEPERLEGQRV